jgi:hypothetical protein
VERAGLMLDTVVNVIRRRPLLLSYIIVVSSVFIFLQYNNPLMPIFSGLEISDGGFALDIIVHFLKLVFNPAMLVKIIYYAVIAAVAAAAAAGLLFSGYSYIILNSLKGKQKFKGEFLYGFKKLSFKIIKVFLLLIISYVLFSVYISVTLVPAIVVTRAWISGDAAFSLLALVLDAITALVLFFSLMFFRAATIFWIPALVSGERKYITASRIIGRDNFWNITRTLVAFDAAFVLSSALFAAAVLRYPFSLALYAVYWLFLNAFLIFFVTYIFDAFLRFTGQKELVEA